jgi:hypothetical protein
MPGVILHLLNTSILLKADEQVKYGFRSEALGGICRKSLSN